RRRRGHRRDVPRRARDRRVRLRLECGDAHRPGRRDRLLALHHEPIPRGDAARSERQQRAGHRDGDVRTRDHVLRPHRRDRPLRDALLPGDVPIVDGHLGRDRRRERGVLRLDVPYRTSRHTRTQPRARPNVDAVTSPATVEPRCGAAEDAAPYAQPRAQLPAQLQALVRGTVGEHIVVLVVVTQKGIYSDEARRPLRSIRALPGPPDAAVAVTGFTAIDLDTVDFIASHTPAALAYIVAATMLVLF